MTGLTKYQSACLEFLALSKMEEELRGIQDYDLRTEVSAQKSYARASIEKGLIGRERKSDEHL